MSVSAIPPPYQFLIIDKCIDVLQLTSLLADIGLNIQEAHAFSTNDGYSLDVFVVAGWSDEVIFHILIHVLNKKNLVVILCKYLYQIVDLSLPPLFFRLVNTMESPTMKQSPQMA